MRASATIGAMPRTTVTIDGDKLDLLRQLAAERGVSVSRLVREAVDAKLAWYRPPGERPKPRSIGIAASGHPDTSELASDFDEIVEAGLEVVRARRKPKAIGVVWVEDATPARQLGDETPEIPPFR